jgi:hypothetical protein
VSVEVGGHEASTTKPGVEEMYPFKPYNGHLLAYYQLGFAKGFVADASTVDPSGGVPNDARAVFDEGVADGAQYAIDGFPVEPDCYDLSHPHTLVGVAAEVVDVLIEGYGVGHAFAIGIAGGIFETGFLLLMGSIALQTTVDDPDKILHVTDHATFSQVLATVGDPVSVELFFGAGVDMNQPGCELKMTRIYKTLGEVRSAFSDLNRSTGYVVSIRTDMSGCRVVEEIG